jgi:hypothetical protein
MNIPNTTKSFRVASRSTNHNAFGLAKHVVVALDGEAFTFCRSTGPHLTDLPPGADFVLALDGEGRVDWRNFSAELVERLPDCPEPVVAEIYGTVTFPKVYAARTQSKHGGAGLFTVDGSYGPFDATAPGMSKERAMQRAEYAAKAINSHAALVAVAEAAKACIRYDAEGRHPWVPGGTVGPLVSALNALDRAI